MTFYHSLFNGFEAGKTYETRDGHEARVYATDGGTSGRKIHGAVHVGDHWMMQSWEYNGATMLCGLAGIDLIAPKPEPQRVWLDSRPAKDEPMRQLECTISPDGALRVV